MADYEIKKGVLGQKVLYNCPTCGVPLSSAFENAGRSDKCPDCQHPHVVPGTNKRQCIGCGTGVLSKKCETYTALDCDDDSDCIACTDRRHTEP